MFTFINLCYVCALDNCDVEATKRDNGGYICTHCNLQLQITELESETERVYAYSGVLINVTFELMLLRRQLHDIGPKKILTTIDCRGK